VRFIETVCCVAIDYGTLAHPLVAQEDQTHLDGVAGSIRRSYTHQKIILVWGKEKGRERAWEYVGGVPGCFKGGGNSLTIITL
jgi:hypothetical protein